MKRAWFIKHKIVLYRLLTLIATTSQSSLSLRREGEEGESLRLYIWALN